MNVWYLQKQRTGIHFLICEICQKCLSWGTQLKSFYWHKLGGEKHVIYIDSLFPDFKFISCRRREHSPSNQSMKLMVSRRCRSWAGNTPWLLHDDRPRISSTICFVLQTGESENDNVSRQNFGFTSWVLNDLLKTINGTRVRILKFTPTLFSNPD